MPPIEPPGPALRPEPEGLTPVQSILWGLYGIAYTIRWNACNGITDLGLKASCHTSALSIYETDLASITPPE